MKKIIIILLATFITASVNAQDESPSKLSTKPSKVAKMKKMSKKDSQKSTEVAPISAEPTIFIDIDHVEFGTIKKGSDPIRTFNVTNQGSKPLLITNCSGSCGCTVPTCPREPIMPGKKAEIKVKYDTNRVGPINKSVTIVTNDPKTPTKTVLVKGQVTKD